MSSVPGFSGVYAVDWDQTAPGDEWGLDPDFLCVGMTWRWRGQATRLDAGSPTLWLDQPFERQHTKSRAQARIQRLALGPTQASETVSPQQDPGALDWGAEPPENAIVLTDGHKLFPARLVETGGRRLLVFAPLLPQAERDLWISALNLTTRNGPRSSVICFLPGTQIATPKGPRSVEDLRPGDLVTTRDSGPQPVMWSGRTDLSSAELYLYPHLRPVRIQAGALSSDRPDETLWVSPDHRLLMHAPAFVGGGEVLVRAANLEDGRGVRRDFGLSAVSYVHLMLERHEIVTANGQPCESFHPGLTDPRVLAWHARSLEHASPGLVRDPARFGDTVRRCLDAGETGILRGALA